jgi:predicted CXXCH cytochrome family protein
MHTIYFLFVFFASLIISALPASADEDCLQCHDELTKGKSVHAAVAMGCVTCHSAIDARVTPHRKTNKIGKGLSSAQPELCFGCHDQSKFKGKVVHAAIGKGCTGCHNPHASKNAKLLTTEPPYLCYTCHDKAGFTKSSVHPPVAKGQCAVCHAPHASDNASLLEKPVQRLCADCHAGKSDGKHILAGYGSNDLHPTRGRPDPLKKNKEFSCVSCHRPHSSNAKALLATESSNSRDFCLTCHTKIMVRP